MNELINRTIDDLMEKMLRRQPPWQKSWSMEQGPSVPTNPLTNKRYTGGNVLNLWLTAMSAGYSTNYWATLKQWNELKASVKRGEKGTVLFVVKEVPDKEDKEKTRFIMRSYWVFNADQIEGWSVQTDKGEAEIRHLRRHLNAAAAIKEMGVQVVTGMKPLYFPALDKITLPDKSAYISLDAYYADLFHEAVHATGHKSRLNRVMSQKIMEYAFEELVAEIGAALLYAEFGMEELPPEHAPASYLSHWLDRFPKNDRSETLVKAARLASKAHEYIVESSTKQTQEIAA